MRILFVCMGNICRSPTAEGVFRHRIAAAGLQDVFESDSAGTHSYHLGAPPDRRSQAAANRRGIDLSGLRARRVDEQDFEGYLDTAGLPNVDLLIRTGGEFRISNFMLWQTAYSELYFTPTLWPDFTEAELDEALVEYSRRQRRFGGLAEDTSS